MKKINKSKILIIVLLLIISIGFAFLTSRLDINGIANVKKIGWNIYFDNVQKNYGEEFEVTAPSTSGTDTTEINFEVALEDPGDTYSFDVDIVNGGTIDAVYKITYDWTSYDTDYPELFIFDVRYKDGIELTENDLLRKDSRETITVTVGYNRDIDISSLPQEDRSVNYHLILHYEQANVHGNTAIERERRYTIAYDLDGGVNNSNNPSTYTDRTESFTLQAPTKEGYTFTGWTIGKNLINTTNYLPGPITSNGVTITNQNGEFTLSGTNTMHDTDYSIWQNTKYMPTLNIDKYYTLSVVRNFNRGFYVQLNYFKNTNSEGALIPWFINKEKTVKPSDFPNYDRLAYLFIGIINSTNEINTTFKIQFEEGNRATDWEPYISTPTTNITIPTGSNGNRIYKANWTAN